MNKPTPQQLKETRLKAGLTQPNCAEMVHVSTRNWQQWEAGDRSINMAAWELFLIKIGVNK